MTVTATTTGFRPPFVIGYTGEAVPQRLRFVRAPLGGVRLSHDRPRPGDWAHGVLIARQRTNRSGRPDFTSVNVRRQWRCMQRGLCQICQGPALDPRSGRVWWLLSDDEDSCGDGFTNAPPTCRDCIPTAITQCPHLRRAAAVYSVASYEPFAVLADVFEPYGSCAILVERGVEVRLDSPALPYALANQLMVRLHDVQPAPPLAA